MKIPLLLRNTVKFDGVQQTKQWTKWLISGLATRFTDCKVGPRTVERVSRIMDLFARPDKEKRLEFPGRGWRTLDDPGKINEGKPVAALVMRYLMARYSSTFDGEWIAACVRNRSDPVIPAKAGIQDLRGLPGSPLSRG